MEDLEPRERNPVSLFVRVPLMSDPGSLHFVLIVLDVIRDDSRTLGPQVSVYVDSTT